MLLSASADSLFADIPAFAPHARPATLLRPTAGTPGVRDGSVGGPLLWPEDEPWPVCRTPHITEARQRLTGEDREAWQRIHRLVWEGHRPDPGEAHEVTDEEARINDQIMAGALSLDTNTWERIRFVPDTSVPYAPMVPVLQLYARDVPELHWPAGTDVLQVLWCPNDHYDLPDQPSLYRGPTVELRYRSSSEVQTVATPPRPDRADKGYLPRPCTVAPLRIVDLPDQDELPEELYEEGCRWAEARGIDFYDDLTCRTGWKVGGWPAWGLTGLIRVDCSCGARMPLFLTMASGDGPDLVISRLCALRVFTCPRDPSHPIKLDIQ